MKHEIIATLQSQIERTATGENRPKQRGSLGRSYASRVIFIVYLGEREQKINSEHYIAVLVRLNDKKKNLQIVCNALV